MAVGLRKASKKQAKLKMNLAGPSGSGKTYSALRLAKGLVGDLEKVVVIDTENGSADLYSDLGGYSVFEFPPPFSPQQYSKAIDLCLQSTDPKFECIIIDSATHEWSGKGGCLEIQQKLGGRFQDWAKVSPMHREFIDKILQAPVHVITTLRKKEEHVIEEVNNKKVVKKMGLQEDMRGGWIYEMTLAFDVFEDHNAKAVKDRTNLFTDGIPELITEKTGEKLRKWCEGDKNGDTPKRAAGEAFKGKGS